MSDDGANGELSRTVNLNLGNFAELNIVAVNSSHIVSVRLTGSQSSALRKMEIQMSNGSTIGMNFDDPDHAESVFAQVVAAINRTIPEYVDKAMIVVPQAPSGTSAG